VTIAESEALTIDWLATIHLGSCVDVVLLFANARPDLSTWTGTRALHVNVLRVRPDTAVPMLFFETWWPAPLALTEGIVRVMITPLSQIFTSQSLISCM
jgi:hypothetical protein